MSPPKYENLAIFDLVSGIVPVLEVVYSGLKAKVDGFDNFVVFVVFFLHPL